MVIDNKPMCLRHAFVMSVCSEIDMNNRNVMEVGCELIISMQIAN